MGRQAQLAMHAWKRKIEETIKEGSQLVAQVVAANQEAGLHPAHTQEALAEIVAGLAETVAVRGRAIRSHDELGRVMGKLDLQELGWGDFAYSPTSAELKRELVKLRSVKNG